MQRSFEIRWFLDTDDRANIEAIKDWYLHTSSQLEFSGEDFPRQDYYLVLRDQHLGIKIREPKDVGGNKMAKFEVKQFVRDLDSINEDLAGKGHADEWVKFSFALQPDEQLAMNIINSFANEQHQDLKAHWIEMKKDRLLLKFNAADGKIYSGEEQLSEGCGIEFTRLLVAGKVYYSFGLESFSETNIGEQNLQKAILFVLSQLGHVPFSNFISWSYPKFLAQLTPA